MAHLTSSMNTVLVSQREPDQTNRKGWGVSRPPNARQSLRILGTLNLVNGGSKVDRGAHCAPAHTAKIRPGGDIASQDLNPGIDHTGQLGLLVAGA